MIAFVAFCVFSSAFYFHALDRGKIFVGIGATLCPLLAITCTYGIVSMTGSRVNSLLFVMPFLIMGVGVDAAFLMVYSWQRQISHNYSSPERL
ncbi:SSD domain-containing protein, partial [Trichostrongylus colubriformis]